MKKTICRALLCLLLAACLLPAPYAVGAAMTVSDTHVMLPATRLG